MGKSFDLSVIFSVVDKITRPTQKIGRSINKLSKPFKKMQLSAKVAFSKVDVGLRKLERRFKKTAEKIERSGFTKIGKRMGAVGRDLTTKLTLPLTILGGVIAKRSIDFETAFTGVRKTVNATEPQLKKLKKELMDMALSLPISTTEMFNIAEAAGQLGIKTKDIAAFAKTMADIRATTNLITDEDVTSLARFAGVLGLTSDEYEELGSVIVDLGNNMEANEKEILNMSMNLLAAGKVAGMTFDQILSLGASLVSVGVQAEAGGTAFSQVMAKISKEIGTGSKKMQDFALVSGKSVEDFEKDWKKDAANTLIDFTEGLKQIQKDGANVNIILDDLGLEGIRVSKSLLLAAESETKFRDALKRGSKARKENTALLKEANLRYKTSASRLKMAKNRVDQLAVSFGDIFVPVILKVVDVLKPIVMWLQKLDPAFKTLIVVVGVFLAIIGPLIIVIGAFVAALGVIGVTVGTATAAIAAIVASIMGFIGLAVLVIKAWEPVKLFFDDLWKSISKGAGAIKDKLSGVIPDFLKFDIGFTKNKQINQQSSNAAAGLIGGQLQRSETDINLKVSADPGTSIVTERVRSKKGNARVNMATVGFVGAG